MHNIIYVTDDMLCILNNNIEIKGTRCSLKKYT